MDKKLINLEEKIAFLDHTIEGLNNVVFRQMQRIDELEETMRHLLLEIEQLKDKSEGVMQMTDEKPPHY